MVSGYSFRSGSSGATRSATRTGVDPASEKLPFSIASTAEDVSAAWGLVYQAYRRAQYIPPNPHEVHVVSQALGPHTAVMLGRVQGVPASTISAIGDNPQGLPLDKVYPEELTRMREEGRRLLEIGLFADRREMCSNMNRTFSAIFELLRFTFFYGMHACITDYLCGIPPRRAKLYARLFGFEQVGEAKSYDTLEQLPVVLMRVELDHLRQFAWRYRGIDYFVKHPVPLGCFDRRYQFEPETLAGTALGRALRTIER